MASLALTPEYAVDIALIVEHSPHVVLLEPEKYDAFYAHVKAKTDGLNADISTANGRDEIRSMAAKVAKSKTAINAARLELTKQWRDQTAQVNEAGKKIDAELTALAADVRKPLTDWEEAEKARKQRCEDIMAAIKADMVVGIDATTDHVRTRGSWIHGLTFEEPEWTGYVVEATELRAQAIETLKAALARLTKEEADRAELARLRAEQAEREERESAERAAREVKEAAEREAREAEERRAVAEQAEKERLASVAHEAEERAKREAEKAAEAERQRIQRDHDAALAAERKRAADAEAAAAAERERIAAERAAEERRLKAEADAKAHREADQAHRTDVKTKAKLAIMSCGASEEVARKIVVAIIAGEVPAVTLEF